MQIVLVPLEKRVLLDGEEDVEIAIRAAVRAWLPLLETRRRLPSAIPAGTVTRNFLFTWR